MEAGKLLKPSNDVTADYRQYYDPESYLFTTVRATFFREGFLSAADFFCIVIWKSNRSKSKIAIKLLKNSNGYQNLDDAVRSLTSEIKQQSSGKERLRYLMKSKKWKFYLPMATAVLSVLYPDEFTIYDTRVCNVLGDFHKLSNKSRFETVWTEYNRFIAAVQKEAPEGLSLKDKDRWLWGKSFWEQLDRDVKNGFSINK